MLWPNSPAHVIFSSVSNTDHQSMANKILYSFSLFTKQSLPLPLGPPLKALTFFAYLFPIEAAPSPRFQNHKDMKIHPPCCFSQAIVFLLSQEILPSLKFMTTLPWMTHHLRTASSLSKTLVFYCIPTYPNIILGHASSAFSFSLGLNSGLLLWSTMNAQDHIRDFLLHPSLKLQQPQLIHLFTYKHVLTTSHGLQSTMANWDGKCEQDKKNLDSHRAMV